MKELITLTKSLGVRLTGSSRKVDMVDRLLAMAKIGAVRDMSIDNATGDTFTGISYMTNEVVETLQQLPTFESISQWKETKGPWEISCL